MTGLAAELLAAWWEWILPLSAQLAALAAIVALIDLLFVRRPRPRLESFLWGLVFLKVVLPPSLASPVSVVRLAGAPPIWTPPGEIALAPVCIACLVWCGGASLFAAAAIARGRHARRLLRTATDPVPGDVAALLARTAKRVGLRRVPQARLVASTGDAAVLGLLQPTVLVPADLMHDRARLEHVLLHECVHLRRGDLWWSHVTLVLAILLWFHPAVWIARGRLAALRELACDDGVARVLGNEAESYRQTLLAVARSVLARTAPLSGGQLAFLAIPRGLLAGGWWGSSLLAARLVHLRDRAEPSPARRVLSGVVAVALTAVVAASCVPLAQPPRPLWQVWAEAPGCLQKRYLLLQAMPPEAPPSTSVPSP